MLDTLHIEASGIPIYIQIRDQILAAIAAGVLKPGDGVSGGSASVR